MPNWCSGVLKVRGTKENILNFLKNGIEPTHVNKKHDVVIDEDNYIDFIHPEKITHYYIKDTRRHFIEGINNRDKYLYKYSEDTFVCVLDDFNAAWCIIPEQLAEISKKYSVDFKIYAFECGMQFNIDIEIVAGEVVKCDEIEFDNYAWECINPFIGG